MSVLCFLASDNFISVNKSLIKAVGLEPAVILGELASEHNYWMNQGKLEDGFFYSTVENLEEKTSLSAHSQRQALSELESRGMIEVVKKGMPAKRFIRLNEAKIIEVVNNQSLKILTTSDEKTEQQDVKNFNTNKKEEIKPLKKEKNEERKTSYDQILNQASIISENPDLKEAFVEFIKMRKLIKSPLTDRALKMVINEAYKLSGGCPELMKQIIDQSIRNSWKDVYPLKEKPLASSGGSKASNPFTEMKKQQGWT